MDGTISNAVPSEWSEERTAGWRAHKAMLLEHLGYNRTRLRS